jgi:hypothetical protein
LEHRHELALQLLLVLRDGFELESVDLLLLHLD